MTQRHPNGVHRDDVEPYSINDGTEPLVYPAVSATHNCEVVGYPDSNKVGVRAGESYELPWIREIVRPGGSLDSFDGEPGAQ